MKRTILTGVVLLLLIIIAADIYNDHNRANDKNKLQVVSATPANSAIGVPPATLGSGNNNTDISANTGDIAQPPVSKNYKHAHARHRQGTIADNDEFAASTPSNSGAGDLDEEDGVPDVGAEISKSFYGNIPKVDPGDLKVKDQPGVVARQSRVHFGPEVSIMQNSFSNEHMPNMDRLGFRAGAIADIGMGDHFALQPGLMYELKGVETESNNSTATMDVDTKDKLNLNYLEVPVDLVVKFGDPHDGRFMIGAGPYIAYLLRAQDHYQTTTTSQGAAARTTQDNPVSDDQGHPEVTNGQYSLLGNGAGPGSTTMRNLDWGVNGFVGCEMPGGVFAKVGTEVGLLDIQHNPDRSYTNHNYNFFLSLGYLIGKK